MANKVDELAEDCDKKLVIKEEPTDKTSAQNISSHKISIDFRLLGPNRTIGDADRFKQQLNAFLQRDCSPKCYKEGTEDISPCNNERISYLLETTRKGIQICKWEDFQRHFKVSMQSCKAPDYIVIQLRLLDEANCINWATREQGTSEPTDNTSAQDTPSHQISIDFCLLGPERTIVEVNRFQQQLNAFLHRDCSPKCYKNGTHDISPCINNRISYLLKKTRKGIQICKCEDFQRHFKVSVNSCKAPSYIVTKLRLLDRANGINWATREQGRPISETETEEFKSYASKQFDTVCTVYDLQHEVKSTFWTGQATYWNMMPPVYVKTKKGWKCFTVDTSKREFNKLKQVTGLPTWMDDDACITLSNSMKCLLKNYLAGLPNQRKVNMATTKYVIYYLVVYENKSCQIYIGKAKNGIEDRWLQADTSHCKKAMNMIYLMLSSSDSLTRYCDLVKEYNIPLVDAYLALTFLKKCMQTDSIEFALFIAGIYTEQMLGDEERNLIKLHDAKNMSHGLNNK